MSTNARLCIGFALITLVACGGSKQPPVTTTAAPAAEAVDPVPSGCPKVTFSCLFEEKYGTHPERMCIEGGADLAKATRASCTPEKEGQPTEGACVRTGALGGCRMLPNAVPRLEACMTTWAFAIDGLKTSADFDARCTKDGGTFIAPEVPVLADAAREPVAPEPNPVAPTPPSP
jgi:hypothetical protein